MAVKRNTSAKKSNAKLTVAEKLGCIHIDNVVVRENKNGNKYIPTPHGAVYSRLNEVKPGLHLVVKLSNGMLALNTPQRTDIMSFLTEQKEETGWSIGELRDFYGV